MEFEDGYQLTEEELLEGGPVIEAGPTTVVVPEKGGKRSIFEWEGQTQEGTVKLAVIRPCVSRGKKIRGLPPIYTQEMLAENAAVYSGWLMYMDHMTEKIREALIELLQEAPGRSVKDLGGRVLRSWFDPTFTRKTDDDNGYKPGVVLAEALLQPGSRAMLAADPEILQVSHNAWPKGAVVGTHWGQKGAIIEGIRAKPEGSVDLVPRGGAGGLVVSEADETAVTSALRSYYASPVTNFADIKDRSALLEAMEKENPALLESLGGKDAVSKALEEGRAPTPTPAAQAAGLTEDDVKRIVTGALKEGEETKKDDETPEQIAERIIAERAESEALSSYAIELIEGAGLPGEWASNLRGRYAMLPSGASPAVKLVESAAESSDDKDGRTLMKEAVDRDLKHAVKLIESAGGKVRVKGLEPEKPDPNGEGGEAGKTVKEKRSQWIDDIGGVGEVKEGSKESDLVTEMLREGVHA